MQRIVLGELDPDSETVREEIERFPELGMVVDEWRRLEGDLERVRQSDAELIENVRGDVTRADRDRVTDFVGTELGTDLPGGGPNRLRLLNTRWLAAIAAMVLAAFLGFQILSQPDERGEGWLGSEACVSPRGEVESFSSFVVDYPLEQWWTIEIVVRSEDGTELLRKNTEELRWDLTAEEIARLEGVEAIQWSFKALDINESPRQGGGSARAWRRP
ncbi:MAG: hypothetical protein GY711_17595 [bacterium]|nr:hypothetical protein [bacterium]